MSFCINYKYYSMIELTFPKRIDTNKTNASKECDICHYWYFLDKVFKFESYVCNDSHDVLIIFMNLSSNTILKVYVVDCRCIMTRISKRETISGLL